MKKTLIAVVLVCLSASGCDGIKESMRKVEEIHNSKYSIITKFGHERFLGEPNSFFTDKITFRDGLVVFTDKDAGSEVSISSYSEYIIVDRYKRVLLMGENWRRKSE
jgi:hypothetical protein